MPDPRIIKTPDGTIHKFPSDATDAEISAALNAPPPTARGTVKSRSWIDIGVNALPTIGGAVGGVIGGLGGTVLGTPVGGVVGATGGATLGGATGEAVKQLINRARGKPAPGTPLEAAAQIGKQGAVQGGSQLAGEGLARGASMAAHGLMDFAIRPAPTVAEEFGDIAGTALKERIPVGSVLPGAQKGSNIARSAMRESAGNTRRLLTGAEKAGTTFSARGVASGPVTEMAGEIAKQPLSDSELNQVARMFSEYLDTRGGVNATIKPNDLKDMKQAAQRIAKPIFRALNKGEVVPAGESLKGQFNKAVAQGAQGALETIPGVAQSEGRTQALIGATKAIRRAEVRRLPLVAEIAAPVAGAVAGGARSAMGGDARSAATGATEGITAAMLTRALLSPRSTSRMALGLTEPAIQQVLQQMPRGAVYSLLQQLTEGDQAPTAR